MGPQERGCETCLRGKKFDRKEEGGGELIVLVLLRGSQRETITERGKSELVLEMDAVSSLVLCWSTCVYVCLVSVGMFVWLRVGH